MSTRQQAIKVNETEYTITINQSGTPEELATLLEFIAVKIRCGVMSGFNYETEEVINDPDN